MQWCFSGTVRTEQWPFTAISKATADRNNNISIYAVQNVVQHNTYIYIYIKEITVYHAQACGMHFFLTTPSGGHTFTAEPWWIQEKLRLPHIGQRHTSNKVLYIKRSEGHFKQSHLSLKVRETLLDKVIQVKSQKFEGQRSLKVRGTLWTKFFMLKDPRGNFEQSHLSLKVRC